MALTIEKLATRTPAELTDEMNEWQAASNTSLANLLELVAIYDREEMWRADGATSMAAWLTFQYGLSLRTAKAWVETAAALVELPVMRDAFADGRLSFDQVRFACLIATPDTDADWAQQGSLYSVARLEIMARRTRTITTEQSSEAHSQRSLRMAWDSDHRFLFLRGQLPEEQGAIVEQAVNRIADRFGKDPMTQTWEPFDARAADALFELASKALGSDSDADRATVVVHVAADALVSGAGSGEIEGGPGLSIETVRRLSCDCRLEVVADDGNNLPIGIGRVSRTIPAWMMRSLRRRDKGCRFPGCHHDRWIHAHHIRYWLDGGPTDLNNLILLCPHHHRMLHELRWTVEGDPDGPVTWIRPDGRLYLSPSGP
jgi:uncharacterized protein DUF222/HNH endonuclease